MMTQILQLLVIAAALSGLVVFGFIRDKREHSQLENDAQESLPFPAPDSSDREHRGAAMSRL
jgi:hypothetical protein